MVIDTRYLDASIKTSTSLKTIAQSVMVRDLSRLSLPEIEALSDLVARVIPAGNVPGVILSGLARLSERIPPPQMVYRDVNLLLRGVEQTLDKAVYLAFFAGPAAAILGYQNLLRLAGKNPEESFPDGTWQFYVEYALRDDTARHANETHGFDTTLGQHRIRLSPVDRATAWTMAAIYCLHQYCALLENEWRERVYARLLREATAGQPDAIRYAALYRDWEMQRPYRRGADAGAREDYAAYRRARYDRFLERAIRELPDSVRRHWLEQVHAAESHELPAYLRQMSILAYLDPGLYQEARTPIPLEQAHIAVIQRGQYYLVPACVPGTCQPADVMTVRAQVAAMMSSPPAPPVSLIPLAETKRAALPGLRARMDRRLLQDLDLLRLAPIVLNCDPRLHHLPLSELRRAERGAGGHPLTILHTDRTTIFDQSHIFFDGAWGAALAEIMTNEALSWAMYLNTLPLAQPDGPRPRLLSLQNLPLELIRHAPHVTEVGVETDRIDLRAILSLRKFLKQRHNTLQLTVNDLLVLYRAIHALTYQADPILLVELRGLASQDATRQAALMALEAMDSSKQVNPAILIPIDGSQRSPRDRLYPMTFEVPIADLDLIRLHDQVIAALDAYTTGTGNPTAAYAEFDHLQRVYLATLAGFGMLLARSKDMAMRGESASVGSIKLLAHMPSPLQQLLDKVPGQFDVLNDIVKGREVFSNVGAVARTSTLTRFITAKDDNEKKTLAWGVITDASGALRLSLRDFRPHVALLQAAGHDKLATRIAQDTVDTFAKGLNRFVRDLQRIVLTRHQTPLKCSRSL